MDRNRTKFILQTIYRFAFVHNGISNTWWIVVFHIDSHIFSPWWNCDIGLKGFDIRFGIHCSIDSARLICPVIIHHVATRNPLHWYEPAIVHTYWNSHPSFIPFVSNQYLIITGEIGCFVVLWTRWALVTLFYTSLWMNGIGSRTLVGKCGPSRARTLKHYVGYDFDDRII